MITFPDWLAARDRKTVQIAPPHQALMLALARAGQRGLSYEDICGLVDLDTQLLAQLLTALVRSGEIALVRTSNGHVYRRLI